MRNINQKIKDELYVINEYGIEHQNPEAKASTELIEAFKDKINLDTTRACINCQIRQYMKYGWHSGLGAGMIGAANPTHRRQPR